LGVRRVAGGRYRRGGRARPQKEKASGPGRWTVLIEKESEIGRRKDGRNAGRRHSERTGEKRQ